MSVLIRFIAEFCQKHLLEEKIFVVPSYQVRHQIGESLTKAGNSWVNLRFATLPSLAQEYAGMDVSQEDFRQISESSAIIILNKVFSTLLNEGRLDYFGGLKPSPGIIRALHNSLYALRMDGIKSEDLEPENFINETCGRIAIRADKYRPVKHARNVSCPVLLQICDHDSITPKSAALETVKKLGKFAEVKNYPIGHFDIYFGDNFEESVSDQLKFFKKHL